MQNILILYYNIKLETSYILGDLTPTCLVHIYLCSSSLIVILVWLLISPDNIAPAMMLAEIFSQPVIDCTSKT